MEARKSIISGLPAKGIKPQLHQPPRQVANEDEGIDVKELTRLEFQKYMGYFIRLDEDEEDIEPEFRRLVPNLQKEEQRLKNEKLKTALMIQPKIEKGESSRARNRRRN